MALNRQDRVNSPAGSFLSGINPSMTKKTTPNAVDADGFHTLTKRQVEEQTKYLDSLPVDEQMRIAAKACGMSITEFLAQINSLHQTAVEADMGMFNTYGPPMADPIIFEYIEK